MVIKNYASGDDMQNLTGQNLAQLEWRYATKTFDSTKKIDDDKIEKLENCLALSPSSYGLQPWRFLVVQNPRLKEKLKTQAGNGKEVSEASHVIVLTTLRSIDRAFAGKYLDRVTHARSVKRETVLALEKTLLTKVMANTDEAPHWNQRQAHIALGFLMENASELGVDSCPLQAIDTGAFDKLLGLEETKFTTVAAAALGYHCAEKKRALREQNQYPDFQTALYL